MRRDPHFGLLVPETCPGVPTEILNPRETWADPAAYDRTARELVARFLANFEQYLEYVDETVAAAAPQAA